MLKHDPSTNQDDLTLRDITFILRTVRTLLGKEKQKVGEHILLDILNEKQEFCILESRLDRNYPRLVTQIILAVCLMTPTGVDEDLLSTVSASIVGAVYAGFKGQVLMA